MRTIERARGHRFTYVDTQDALDRFVEEALESVDGDAIALDIEEDREQRFRPSVALIQITVGDDDYVIDPVRLGRDALMVAVEALCLTPSVVVMHGCRNDVTGLKRDFGVGPRELRDTQLAARFAGLSAFGLAPLLQQIFDITLDKAVRRSKWIERPLTDSQLAYARDDTRYLLCLWDELEARVAERGWTDALDEESEALGELQPETQRFDPDAWRRIRGAKKLDDQAQARAAQLWRWRTSMGSTHDLHPSRVLAPWALLHLATQGARAMDSSRAAQSIPKCVCDDDLDELHDLLRSPPKLVQSREPSRKQRGARISRDLLETRMERLAEWRTSASAETGLEPGFLAPRSLLERIARAEVEDPDGYADVPEVRAWRARRFADDWFDLR